jgi:hypothetical protein
MTDEFPVSGQPLFWGAERVGRLWLLFRPEARNAMSKRKLSRAMIAALRNLQAGRPMRHGIQGMAAHGGLARTYAALLDRGLVAYGNRDELTPRGRKLLAELDTPGA